jgi:hypothetical protein
VHDSRLRAVLAGSPTQRRAFFGDETLSIFAEVYDNYWMLSRDVRVTSTIRTASGEAVSSAERSLQAGNGEPRYEFSSRLPLRTMSPGDYILTVEAQSTAVAAATASRQLRFSVIAN